MVFEKLGCSLSPSGQKAAVVTTSGQNLETFTASEFTELEGTPVKPNSLYDYHEEPLSIPFDSSPYIICIAKGG